MILLALALGAGSGAWAAEGGHGEMDAPGHGDAQAPGATALDLAAVSPLAAILPRLADVRVVYVSEVHNRLEHHLNQLAIIRGLHERDPNLAIAMEFFQQPFQEHLDDYVAGRIDEQQMLRRTEYYDRWRFDYRLYRPILRFARDHGIPLVALGLATERTGRLREVGLEGLDAEERAALPAEIDYSDEPYAERLRAVYAHHPANTQGGFERFMEVQLVWDEVMAERAAEYLAAHPDRRLVVLAGGGHVNYGSGIPRRVVRRVPVEQAIVVNDAGHGVPETEMGDYLLLTPPRELPAAGKMGVLLEDAGEGVVITGFAEGSPGKQAGLREGDVILAVDDDPVERFADVKLALWDKRPGEQVQVRVERERWLVEDDAREFQVELR